MRTDMEWIESFLRQTLTPAELDAFAARRAEDGNFRQTLLLQAKVHLASILYGRNKRRVQILQASEKIFADLTFSNQVQTIFK